MNDSQLISIPVQALNKNNNNIVILYQPEINIGDKLFVNNIYDTMKLVLIDKMEKYSTLTEILNDYPIIMEHDYFMFYEKNEMRGTRKLPYLLLTVTSI